MRILISLFVALFFSAAIHGQNNEKVESFKIAFITQKLNLTSDEAQKFWPIFNEMQNAIRQSKQASRNEKPVKDMTEEEAARFIKESLDAEQKEYLAKQNAYNKFKGVISNKKIAMLRQVEREFKEEMLKKMQERREMKRNRAMGDN